MAALRLALVPYDTGRAGAAARETGFGVGRKVVL